MIALAHPHRKIGVTVMDEETLLAERTKLLKQVGHPTAEALFNHIKHGDYSVEERVTAERLEGIHWLLREDT